MTKKQLELLGYIREFIELHGYSPSFEEMKTATGLGSKSGVFRLLNGLEAQGRIVRLRNRARAIEIPTNPCITRPMANFTNEEIVREVQLRGMVAGYRYYDNGALAFSEIHF